MGGEVTIDPDVARLTHEWGLDPALIQAVDRAEGNLLRAVQCSIPSVTTHKQAIEVTCRSATHALSDWVRSDPDRARAFVQFWAARWAPVGAENDPKGLNAAWPRNVSAIWLGAKQV